jgi:hypothetical protein
MTSLSKISFNTSTNILSGTLSIALTAFIIIFPPFILFFLKKYKYKLENPEFKKKFDALYDNVDTHKDSCIYLVPFFLFRRLILGLTIIFVDDMVCI